LRTIEVLHRLSDDAKITAIGDEPTLPHDLRSADQRRSCRQGRGRRHGTYPAQQLVECLDMTTKSGSPSTCARESSPSLDPDGVQHAAVALNAPATLVRRRMQLANRPPWEKDNR
jgi:hypothetical protein